MARTRGRDLSGETDLARLLAELAPRLHEEQYEFMTLAPGEPIPPDIGLFAMIAEDEGMTLIGEGEGWARITLDVRSSLSAVGLTATFSAALAQIGIAANVIAGYHHDHVFVPWHRREQALAVLEGLTGAR